MQITNRPFIIMFCYPCWSPALQQSFLCTGYKQNNITLTNCVLHVTFFVTIDLDNDPSPIAPVCLQYALGFRCNLSGVCFFALTLLYPLSSSKVDWTVLCLPAPILYHLMSSEKKLKKQVRVALGSSRKDKSIRIAKMHKSCAPIDLSCSRSNRNKLTQAR